jgi:hypothetical protein
LLLEVEAIVAFKAVEEVAMLQYYIKNGNYDNFEISK